jgi:hypothetical protein
METAGTLECAFVVLVLSIRHRFVPRRAQQRSSASGFVLPETKGQGERERLGRRYSLMILTSDKKDCTDAQA